MDKQIDELYSFLQKHSLIKQLVNNSQEFYDEPKPFVYDLLFNDRIEDKLKKNGLIMYIQSLSASGISFNSKKFALLKCLTEAIERICQFSFLEENTFIEKYSKLKRNALNPFTIKQIPNIEDTQLGWVTGKMLGPELTKTDILIPAQLVYINYQSYRKGSEPLLAFPISTGGATGYTYEETVLRGIYEVIERDSIMNMYLGSIPVPHIDLSSIESEKINKILKKIKNYKLSLTIFYILNDFGIPTYLTVLIDKTSIGPKVSVGMKTTFNPEHGIIGSIEEAMLMRLYTRRLMREFKRAADSPITTIPQRALFWANPNATHFLDFLSTNSEKKTYKSLARISDKDNEIEELQRVVAKITKKGYSTYVVNIKLPVLKQISNLQVFKVIIPDLQPLYLDETKKIPNMKRLKEFAKAFNKSITEVNPIPHPYL